MENNNDVEAIEEAFKRIIVNRVFKRSSLQERILRFLIDQAIAGNDVTEHAIGVELFKDKYTVNQNDSKIRVYVFYLRKKLAEYYNGIGKDENIIFHTEKGHYNLVFKKKSDQSKEVKDSNYINLRFSKKKTLYIIVGVIMSLIVALVAYRYNKQTFIWQPFLEDNTLCVIADHYMIADRNNKNNYHYSTYRNINSEADAIKFKADNPDLNLIPAGFTMTTKMASFGVHYLDIWFNKHNKVFDIQLESDTQHTDYLNKNVIYIGQAKKMQESKTFFLRNSKVFKLTTNGFVFKGEGKEIIYKGTHDEIKDEEFAMVSYQKIDNGMYRMFFVSNHDIGVVSTIKMFTSPKKMKKFMKKLPSLDARFNALFKVSGLKRTEMSCELVELEVVLD